MTELPKWATELKSEFKDLTPPEFACSYSASCPSVKISEDERTLRISGAFVKINPEWTEVTLDISADLVRAALAAEHQPCGECRLQPSEICDVCGAADLTPSSPGVKTDSET